MDHQYQMAVIATKMGSPHEKSKSQLFEHLLAQHLQISSSIIIFCHLLNSYLPATGRGLVNATGCFNEEKTKLYKKQKKQVGVHPLPRLPSWERSHIPLKSQF